MLRALAIFGVVLGHWLVTAWERAPGLVISSPLAYLPHLAPLSWVLQTLAVFFLVGGYVAGLKGRPSKDRSPGGASPARRVARLLLPVVPLAALWAVLIGVLVLVGVPYQEVRALALPALAPLWFLAVFVALTALAPLLARLPMRITIAGLVAVVAAVDLGRFVLGAPGWIGWLNVSAWAVPYLMGVLWARGALTPRHGWRLLGAGAAATAALIGWFGYPASMVGVTGARVSNLSPPTLAALTFGVAQVGLALLLHGPLSRVTSTTVTLVNRAAMPIFLWHQTALVLIVTGFGQYGRPDSPAWIAQRLAVIAIVLGFMTWCRHRLDVRLSRL